MKSKKKHLMENINKEGFYPSFRESVFAAKMVEHINRDLKMLEFFGQTKQLSHFIPLFNKRKKNELTEIVINPDELKRSCVIDYLKVSQNLNYWEELAKTLSGFYQESIEEKEIVLADSRKVALSALVE